MDYKELIERLYYHHKAFQKGLVDRPFQTIHDCKWAADTLTTLTEENTQLRAELSNYSQVTDWLRRNGFESFEALTEAFEQVKRERDAAIEDWRGFCAKCAWNGKQHLSDGKMDARCVTCRANNKCNWEWRGPQKEE